MANIFQIVSSSETLQLDKERRGEVAITVTNIAKSVAGRALIVPIGDTDESWLKIEGDEERELQAGVPEELKVTVELPEDAPEGELKFRVDVVSEVNPDDDFSEGPEITILPPPVSKLWLWILLAVVFLLIVVVVAWWVVSSGKEDAASSEEPVAGASVEGEGGEAEEEAAAVQRYMPNLMGLTLKEAKKQAAALQLRVEGADLLFGGDELAVSGQTPRPGQPIEENGTVTLELSAEMPDLIGMEEADAGLALIEAGIWPGELTYRVSDRQEAGKILEQSIAPQVETEAGTTVDLVFSIGSCYWTSPFGRDFGMVSCRSGSAVSGLYCGNKNCGLWQLYCCPYWPSSDLEAELTQSGWIPPDGSIGNRKDSFLDAWECKDSGCPKMQSRYVKTPRLKKSSDCRPHRGKSWDPVRCDEGRYVAEFTCLKGKTCNEWQMTCCSGESIPPE